MLKSKRNNLSESVIRRGNVINNIVIAEAVSEGVCIAKVDEFVVFVKFAAPGDVADIEITYVKKRYAEAKIINLISPSPQRVKPFCEHFGTCGGCKWQHFDYQGQLQMKLKTVTDSLTRIGKVDYGECLPIVGSNLQSHYRNKLDFTFSDYGWISNPADVTEKREPALGFNIPGRWDKVFNVKSCKLMDEKNDEIRVFIRNFAIEHHLPFFNLIDQTGFLRNLIIRNSTLGQWMVILVFTKENQNEIKELNEALLKQFPYITSLVYFINSKKNQFIGDLELQNYFGPGYIEEKLGEMVFRIRPQSFFQTNSTQTEQLYEKVLDFAGLTGKEVVYDLYTGTGTIALFMANSCEKVIGIEYVEQAIVDAKENAKLNNVKNAFFFSGDMKTIFTSDFVNENGKPDVIVIDPPRDGMHPDVVKTLLNLKCSKIVYVSCNPATQARDLALLSEIYNCEKIQPMDMFPHTHHVENIAILQLRS